MFNTPEEVFYSIIVGVILMLFLATIFVLSLVRYRAKIKMHIHETQELQNQFSKILLQSELEIQEQTLQNISYELHDNLGQLASLIKIHLNTIPKNKPDEALNRIAETKALTEELIKGIKLLSLNLNGNRLGEIGLFKALHEEVERLNKLKLFKINFKIIGDEFPLAKDQTIILYRMSQEIVNNIIKHSKASEIVVTIQFLENLLTLVFHDNGMGFNVVEKMHVGGNGLINLQNRATAINAKLNIESFHNKGTTVTIEKWR